MDTNHPQTNVLKLMPGQRIRVTQTIVGRDKTWTARVEGTVISYQAEPTGSWYAHGKNDRLWLQRIRLRKDDGEITALAIDHNTQLTLLK